MSDGDGLANARRVDVVDKLGVVTVEVVPDEESPLLSSIEPDRRGGSQSPLADVPQNPFVASTISLRSLTLRLFVPFFLYCLAQGAVAAPKVNVVLALFCIKHRGGRQHRGGISNDDICATPGAQGEMAQFMVYAHLMSGVLCIFSSPRIGALSDRYGRKPLIAFSVIGILLGDVVSLIAASFPVSIPAYLMLIEFIVGGLTGTFFTTLALVQSYTADCTSGAQRTKAFGILYAFMYSGMGTGPALGAVWVQKIGRGHLSSLFLTAGVSHLIFVCYILFVVPESAPKLQRHLNAHPEAIVAGDTGHSTTNPLSRACNVLAPLKMFSNSRGGPRRRMMPMAMLAFIDVLSFGVQIGLPALLVLYSESQFQWKTSETSYFLSLINIVRAVVLAVVLPSVVHLTRIRRKTSQMHGDTSLLPDTDTREIENTALAVVACLVLEVLGQVGFATARSPTAFVLSGAVAAAASPIIPTTQSLMSLCVQPERLGELFGAIGLLHSISRILVPASMQMIYGVTIGYAQCTVFWALGVFFSLVLLVALWFRFSLR